MTELAAYGGGVENRDTGNPQAGLPPKTEGLSMGPENKALSY